MSRRLATAAVLLLALAGVVYVVADGRRAGGGAAEPPPGPAARLIVYWLDQGKHCDLCERLPVYAREALDTHFAAELAAGVVEWRALDVDEPAHAHYVGEFGLYAKAVVLVRIDGGRRGAHKNLTAVWDLAYDRPAYIEYVRAEVRGALDGAW